MSLMRWGFKHNMIITRISHILRERLTFAQKIKCIWFLVYYSIIGIDNYDIKLSNGNEIRSTNVKKCVDCKCNITEANDSGWEVFVSSGYTQPICKKCDIVRNKTIYLKQD